jgi:hypothetical protein
MRIRSAAHIGLQRASITPSYKRPTRSAVSITAVQQCERWAVPPGNRPNSCCGVGARGWEPATGRSLWAVAAHTAATRLTAQVTPSHSQPASPGTSRDIRPPPFVPMRRDRSFRGTPFPAHGASPGQPCISPFCQLGTMQRVQDVAYRLFVRAQYRCDIAVFLFSKGPAVVALPPPGRNLSDQLCDVFGVAGPVSRV